MIRANNQGGINNYHITPKGEYMNNKIKIWIKLRLALPLKFVIQFRLKMLHLKYYSEKNMKSKIKL